MSQTVEALMLTVLDAASDAADANEWFDTELDLWLLDVRRFAAAALSRARELRLLAALEDPAA